MPGFLVHLGAQVMCVHGGQAQPTAVDPSVLVSGQPVATLSAPYLVAGCALPPPIVANGPCLTGQFITGSTRVLVNGLPVLLFDSQAICAPTGTPLIIAVTQVRVNGI